MGKGAESLPVGDFGFSSRGPIDFGSVVTSGCFALQPLVDGIATDVENLASFALLEAIEFDRLNDLLAEVIAVCIGHGE